MDIKKLGCRILFCPCEKRPFKLSWFLSQFCCSRSFVLVVAEKCDCVYHDFQSAYVKYSEGKHVTDNSQKQPSQVFYKKERT